MTFPSEQERIIKTKEGYTSGAHGFTKKPVPLAKVENFRYFRDQKSLKCYGCGNHGFIKTKPRTEDFWQHAKYISFMSTIDLMSGC